MGTLLKINDLSVERLNNAEYTNYMNRFRAHFKKQESGEDDRPVIQNANSLVSSDTLGFSKETVEAFDTNLALMEDIVNQSHISDETAMLADEDKNRDELIVYYINTISQTRNSPIAAQKAAAISLYNQVKTYRGIQKLADQQETQQINGLLIDMEKEPNKTNVATLNLKPVLEQIKASNQRFIALTAQRTENRAVATIENGKIIRARLDPIYDDMVLLAIATNLIKPTAETTAFITSVNALIAETKARYNQRVGIAKANKAKKKPADDKPADNKPADDKPADDKPVDNKPADDKPADDKPVDNTPEDNRPVIE